MIKKCIYLQSLLIVAGCFTLCAQTQTDSTAKANEQKQVEMDSIARVNAQRQSSLDSINKVNQQKQAQITQDSLKKVQEVNTQKSEPVKAAETSSGKKDTRPLGQRLHFSFSSGFWIDVNSIYFEVCPMITYKFPKVWSIGTGPVYILNQDRKTSTTLNGWGGRIYGRADITKWLYAWTEYQGIDNQHLSLDEHNEFVKDYEYVDSWFLSLGLYIRLGRKALGAQALYDVLYKKDNSYAYSPWSYRLSFGF